MTYYNTFDSTIQCEEGMEVSPEEQAEIFQMMAEEHQAFEASGEWSAEVDQQTFEQEQEQKKDWTGDYKNHKPGKTYNGIDV